MRFFAGVLIASILGAACDAGPREKDVRSEFLRANPGARIESLAVAEGDGEHVYYHIRFREAGDLTPRETMWLYARQSDGSWRNTHRDQP
jgi:hypothetical protein